MSLFSSINPIAFNLFGIDVNWYGLIIVSGMLVAIILASKEAVRVGLTEDDVIDFMFWGLPLSIVGARLYYVAFEWPQYADDPIQIFAIRNGGLAIYGGLLAGGLVMYFFAKKRGISFWQFLDIAVPGVVIAQAIGRWGNFMNQEAYGGETTRAFLESMHLPQFIINNMEIAGVYHHPTFLYESLWNVLGFILLLVLRRRKEFLKIGELTFVYVMWYAFGRFFIEGMRTDSLWIFDIIRVSQLLSVILFIVALGLLIYRRRVVKPDFYRRDLAKK